MFKYEGCVHYKYIVTNDVYSWDFTESEWMQHDKEYKDSLMDLFD